MFAIIALLLAPVVQPAAQVAGVTPEARAAIAAANADWLPALKSGDVMKIAAPYADDGVFVGADGATFTGRNAIAQLMRDRIARMGTIVSGELVQDGMTRQGSFIYEWGHATLRLAREGATPTESRGRYLTVWRQGPTGRWEISRNLSLPE